MRWMTLLQRWGFLLVLAAMATVLALIATAPVRQLEGEWTPVTAGPPTLYGSEEP